jgi:sugar lactone lactonase YvrE
VYSTFLGGASYEEGQAIAVNASGYAYVTGGTSSPDFPTVNSISPFDGGDDSFVAELTPSGSMLVFSTYLGAQSEANGIALDQNGNVYIAGVAYSASLPTTPLSAQPNYGGGTDAFVAKLLTSGPAVNRAPRTLTFEATDVGVGSLPQDVTLSDTGNQPLANIVIATSGDFSQTNTCGNSLDAGASCTVAVTFTPSVTGTRAGTIAITDNAQDSPQNIVLSGNGVTGPLVQFSPASLSFPPQIRGTTSTVQVVTLTNRGNVGLNISSLTASGDFTQTNNCGSSVAAGASCTINVTFAPATVGSETAQLTVTDNAFDSPQTVSLSGTGTCQFTATPSAVSAAWEAITGPPYICVYNGPPVTAWSCPLASSTIQLGSNCGAAPFTLSLSESPYLVFGATANGSTTPATITLRAEPYGNLPQPTIYNASLTVNGATPPLVVPITIAGVMSWAVDPQELSFQYALGGPAPPSQELTVYSPLGWQVGTLSVSGGSWLSPSGLVRLPVEYQPYQSAVSVNPSGLPVGTYQAQLLYNFGATMQGQYYPAPNSPLVIPVTLTVINAPVLGTNALLVGSAGGTSSVALSYSGAWTATASGSFLHISSGSAGGTGSAVVAFTYDPFTGTGTRSGTLTIAGLTVTVTQGGTNYVGPYGSSPGTALVSSGLSSPFGLAVDGSGNVYVADTKNNAVKKWTASTQQVTTLVSSGLNKPSGVAVDSSGNVYIADTGNFAIKEWGASTQQVTTLVSSGLLNPTGVAVDGSGNVYAADGGNAVYEWSASTQQVSTLAQLSSPTGVAVDGSGNVYIASTANNAVYEWNASTQQVTTLVSSGLHGPYGVAVDGSGNVYIADTNSGAVKGWSASTQQVTTLASAGLNGPCGVAVDGSGSVYIADTGNNAIKELPYAFVSPANLTEPASAGTGSLLPVLPSTAPLTGVFAPTSDQNWLTIGAIASGVVGFSFSPNTSTSRVAHIAVLGQRITVTQDGSATQTINFGAVANQVVGTAPFTVSATASSGLPVSFASLTSAVCTVSVATVTLVSAGTCTIQAMQAGNIDYTAATPVDQSFQVVTLAITSLSPVSAAPSGAAFTLTVNGTAFVSGATVHWNGATLSTNFVSATQLTASVPAALIASAGMATITVANPGAVTSGGVGFPIQSGPEATAVSPGAGNGASQTFTFTFSDPAGYQNLGVLDVLINNYLDGIQACYVALVPSGANAGTVYLVDDGGDAGGPFAGNLTLPGTGSVSNSQCTVSGTGSSVVGSGTTITLTLNISFSASFAGNRVFYTAARDTGTGNSGWQALSTWTVPGATATPTQATGVTPASGSGASQSFVFTFADSAGWQDLGVVDVLFNNFLDGIQGCYIAYSVPAATLYLVDDGGDAGGPFAGYLALPGTGSMSNSQCTVNGTGSSAAGSGNTLTLTLNVSFTGAFAGNRIFYTAAGNAAGTENSGWNALGAWTVP